MASENILLPRSMSDINYYEEMKVFTKFLSGASLTNKKVCTKKEQLSSI